ncbi:MAG TPA: HepT-like ribonuclease domain-containing protein [Longimicrobiales bacterium]|nr:HepT-like ribonuclease domain-containing protein [Longimicrobiales bacterium]
MTYLVERLAQLRRYLDHLARLRPKVRGPEDLRSDLSLHNDVLFSLLSVAQLVIDMAGELAAQRAETFDDYTEAVRALAVYDEFPSELVEQLARLPGFRNIVMHEYVKLDLERAVEALDTLEPVEEFARIVARILEAKAD